MLALWLALASAAPCAFDDAQQQFVGTPTEQAACLLRDVRQWGHLGPVPPRLPEPLQTLVGQPTAVQPESFTAYIQAAGIHPNDIGGPIADPLCTARNNAPDAASARYFVIHDTSTPIPDMNGPFPDGIDSAEWRGNDLTRWAGRPIAHVFVSRVGQSITTRPFSEPSNWATKFERDHLDRQGGLMLHIELIQPRRRDPNGGARNDAIAPDVGFTDAQLDRLALLYIAASVRKGQWLIPAFHSAVDDGIPDAHDDPQNFDLDRWAERLAALITLVSEPQ